jgi:N-acylneuraminate cytidylyltransferase
MQLGDKPLIVWSVDIVQNVDDICDILVSTDHEEIADISREAGALVPWLRPAELSGDTATSVDVAQHALNWYEGEHGKVDGLLLLQPTSPFRTRESVLKGIATYQKCGGKPVIGVSPAQSHPMWCFKIDGEGMEPFCDGGGLHLRSQDLPSAYEVNGGFYLASPEEIRVRKSFFGEGAVPLIMPQTQERVDIDTEADFLYAQALLAQ